MYEGISVNNSLFDDMTGNIKDPSRIYFENLNSIRFIAAFLVIIHHVEQFKKFFNLPVIESKLIVISGQLGVLMFFVLSGFLISFLLFKEKEVTGKICVRNFYIRRILRIWPLYFLIIFSSLFIFPMVDLFAIPGFERNMIWSHLLIKVILYLFFLPNLVLSIYNVIPFASQTWSIGAEEQFYLIWPLLNKHVKNKWKMMAIIIVLYLLVKYVFKYMLQRNLYADIIYNFWAYTPIDCMAIGGLFALIVYEQHPFAIKVKSFIFTKSFQAVTLLITIILIVGGYSFPHFNPEVYSILFGILICNFACNNDRLFSMEFAWLNYLGKISYGLYMYHPVVIVFGIKVLQKYNLYSDYLFYPLTFCLAILLAFLSYELFEKRFINKKVKFSNLLSGDNARLNITMNNKVD